MRAFRHRCFSWSRPGRRWGGLILGVLLGLPAQAGLLERLEQLGLLDLLQPLADSAGIDLPAAITALDAELAMTPLDSLLAEDSELGLDAGARADLLSMDAPAFTAASDASVLPSASGAGESADQPALAVLTPVEAAFREGRIQPAGHCADADQDGVCDRDDQCLHTPAATRVLANGCYLTGATPLRLETVHFDSDSTRLSAGAYTELDTLAAVILASSARKIELAGYTDSRGNARHNQALSEARAQAVVDYLLSRGVPLERLSARGYGEAQPLVSNDSEAGRARNRRVELRVITQ